MSEPMMPQTPPPKPRWTAAAVTLVVIGFLILVPSGLCTGVFGIASISSAFRPNGSIASGLLFMALIIGGPFIVLGALLIRTGLRERKRD